MKSKIEKVLFITEKWCDGDPRKGITNSYHNLFGTFTHSFPHIAIGVLHLDEVSVLHGQHVDTVIPQALNSFSPDLVVVSHLGSSPMNPTINGYRLIKDRNIPICFTWPDTRDWVLDAIRQLDEVADLHVSFGGEEENPINEKHINLWAPQDPRLYYNDKKFIPVSFTGSLQGNYTYRRSYVQYLIDNDAPLIVAGGQREQGLPAEEYAMLVRCS